MRFVPRLSIGRQLTLVMILVVALSWLLSSSLIYQLSRMNILRPPPRRPPPRIEVSGENIPRESAEEPPPSGAGRPDLARGPRGGPPFGPGPRLLFIHLGVGVVVAVAAGLWLSRRFSRPLAMLAQGAQALRAGELGHRVALAGDDEFARVATSMNQMAERIAKQIQQLEADARRRQHLLADVAHELRSPVASMKTMAEALRDGIASGPERSQRAARAIAESAERMERLVKDMLELARLDLDELPLYRQPVDLRALVADCLRSHRQAADAAGIQIHPSADGQPVVVSGDPHRLNQVLDNLLDNAISHAGRGAEVRVTIDPRDPVVVTVADTGRGIAAEHLPYLFDPFYRVDVVRTPGQSHSGLGLRIARGLAQAHGGDLRIESEEGKGTRAVLTLPAS